MADKNTAQFSLVGRFKSFVPGKKSPYQKLLLEVKPAEESDQPSPTANSLVYSIKLAKPLRKTLHHTLQPQDAVSVIGELSHKRNGKPKWRAIALSKLPSVQTSVQTDSQPDSQTGSQTSVQKDLQRDLQSDRSKETSKASKPARILVCQKSSCRKRGSLAVTEAIKQEIAQSQDTQQVTVLPTGCLGGCKSGPNAVTVPGKKQRQVKHAHLTPKKGRSLVKAMLAPQP